MVFDDGPMRVNPTIHRGATAERIGTAQLETLGRGLFSEGLAPLAGGWRPFGAFGGGRLVFHDGPMRRWLGVLGGFR